MTLLLAVKLMDVFMNSILNLFYAINQYLRHMLFYAILNIFALLKIYVICILFKLTSCVVSFCYLEKNLMH